MTTTLTDLIKKDAEMRGQLDKLYARMNAIRLLLTDADSRALLGVNEHALELAYVRTRREIDERQDAAVESQEALVEAERRLSC